MGLIQWLLKRFDHRKTEHAAERRIRNTAGETEVAQFVVPVVKYDVETGEFKNFDQWDDPQTFDDVVTFNALTTHGAGLCVPIGKKIVFGACAGDDYITQAVDDQLDFYLDGALILHMEDNATQRFIEFLGTHFKFHESDFIVLDNDEDSGLDLVGDDEYSFQTGGGACTMLLQNAGVTIQPLLSITGNINVSGYAVDTLTIRNLTGEPHLELFRDSTTPDQKWIIRIGSDGTLTFRDTTYNDNVFNFAKDWGGQVFTTSGNNITVNADSIDKNFQVKADDTSDLLWCDAGSNEVGIMTNTPNKTLDVNGDISLEAGSGDYYSNDGSQGYSGSFTEHTGKTVTVKNGIITSVV